VHAVVPDGVLGGVGAVRRDPVSRVDLLHVVRNGPVDGQLGVRLAAEGLDDLRGLLVDGGVVATMAVETRSVRRVDVLRVDPAQVVERGVFVRGRGGVLSSVGDVGSEVSLVDGVGLTGEPSSGAVEPKCLIRSSSVPKRP
jgi:hypothetical protein